MPVLAMTLFTINRHRLLSDRSLFVQFWTSPVQEVCVPHRPAILRPYHLHLLWIDCSFHRSGELRIHHSFSFPRVLSEIQNPFSALNCIIQETQSRTRVDPHIESEYGIHSLTSRWESCMTNPNKHRIVEKGAERGIRTPEDVVHRFSRPAPWARLSYLRLSSPMWKRYKILPCHFVGSQL